MTSNNAKNLYLLGEEHERNGQVLAALRLYSAAEEMGYIPQSGDSQISNSGLENSLD